MAIAQLEHLPEVAEPKKTKYEIRENRDAFAIRRGEGPAVVVQANPTSLRVMTEDWTQSFGFYSFYKILDSIVQRLMSGWQGREDRHWGGAHRWAKERTRKAICRRVHAQWVRLLREVDPTILAVHRAIFAATFDTAELAMTPDLYADKQVVGDIIKYRAAAIAARHIVSLATRALQRKVEFSREAEQLRALAARLGAEVRMSVYIRESDEIFPLPTVSSQLAFMQDWMALFADTGGAYRSLRRTLMNLPGHVPSAMVCNLNSVRLGRPFTDRLEFLTLGAFASLRSGRQRNYAVFHNARRLEIAEAVRRVGQYTHNELSPNKGRDMTAAVNFLTDCPDDHRGNIVGLADKAIRWHRDRAAQQNEVQLRELGPETFTKAPPIPLPEIPGVRFLDTVRAVCDEGTAMEHCVASYADSAIHGYSYLFHVERQGEHASVEVDWRGRVAQAHGPRNRENNAVKWAKKILQRWGAQFPEGVEPPDHGPRRPIGGGNFALDDLPF